MWRTRWPAIAHNVMPGAGVITKPTCESLWCICSYNCYIRETVSHKAHNFLLTRRGELEYIIEAISFFLPWSQSCGHDSSTCTSFRGNTYSSCCTRRNSLVTRQCTSLGNNVLGCHFVGTLALMASTLQTNVKILVSLVQQIIMCSFILGETDEASNNFPYCTDNKCILN